MRACYDLVNKYLKLNKKLIKKISKTYKVNATAIEDKLTGMMLVKCYSKISAKVAQEVIC